MFRVICDLDMDAFYTSVEPRDEPRRIPKEAFSRRQRDGPAKMRNRGRARVFALGPPLGVHAAHPR